MSPRPYFHKNDWSCVSFSYSVGTCICSSTVCRCVVYGMMVNLGSKHGHISYTENNSNDQQIKNRGKILLAAMTPRKCVHTEIT